MKKKIFKVALAVVIMGAGFFVWQSQHSESMSELVLANVEALARGEMEGEGRSCFNSYSTGVADSLGFFIRPCSSCPSEPNVWVTSASDGDVCN